MEYLNNKEISKVWTTETPFYFYKTTNLINGKFYYGSGSRPNYLGSGVRLTRAIKKYGKENFHIEKLRFFKTREDAYYYEDRFLKLHKINSLVESYNLINSGDTGTCGLKHSQETKDKMSAASKGKPKSQESKDKMSAAKQNMSQETKDKLSAAQTGKKATQETKDKLSEMRRGCGNQMFGKKHSQETRDKIGVKSKGRNVGKNHSQETKDKMSAAMTGDKNPMFGKPITQEHREKLILAAKNRVMTQEHKDKIIASNKNRKKQ
jgi:group I intron endonuclease